MSEKEAFCRCCLNKVGEFSSMKAVNITALNGLLNVNGYIGFFDCTGFIKIPKIDENPKICYSCELNLDTTIIFLQQCRYTNQILTESFFENQEYFAPDVLVQQKQGIYKNTEYLMDEDINSDSADSIDVGILNVKEQPMIKKKPVINRPVQAPLLLTNTTISDPNLKSSNKETLKSKTTRDNEEDSIATETASENESAGMLEKPKLKNRKYNFKCSKLFCAGKFTTKFALNRHLKENKHTGVKKQLIIYRCVNCNRKFKGQTAFKTHKKCFCFNSNYECSLCSKFLENVNVFKDHLQEAHDINFLQYSPKYKCEICEDRFHNSYKFCQHLKNHNSVNADVWKKGRRSQINCASCNKVFTVLSSFKNHIKICKSDFDQSVTCNFCPKPRNFSNLSWYYSHLNEKHMRQISSVNCKVCGIAVNKIGWHDMSKPMYKEHLLRKHNLEYDEIAHGYPKVGDCENMMKFFEKSLASGNLNFFKCNKCSEIYLRKTNYEMHLISCEQKTYTSSNKFSTGLIIKPEL